jgi:multidrug efflux pump subunit AcrB
MTTLRTIALATLASILGVTPLALALTFGSFLTSVFQSI